MIDAEAAAAKRARDLLRDASLLRELGEFDDRDSLIGRGLCRTQPPERFFPVDEIAYGPRAGSPITPSYADQRWADAKAICGRCPVRIPCLAYAVTNPGLTAGGVWGGRDREERLQISRRIAPSRS